MKLEIQKGSAQFCYAVQNPQQLPAIFAQINPDSSPSGPFCGLGLVGRSNVGKSSLINALFGKCLAKTSKTPGRTRSINIFQLSTNCGRPLWLFDLPGYGFAKVSQNMRQDWDSLMATFFELAPSSLLLANIQDARHPKTSADDEFHRFLRPFAFPLFVIFNKMDKLKTQRQRALFKRQKLELSPHYPRALQIHFVSATEEGHLPQRQKLASALSAHFFGD